MSRLSDVVNEACAEARDGFGRTVVQQAVAFARGRLDEDDRDTLVDEALARRCKTVAEKARKSVRAAAAEANLVDMFPDLRAGYALDNEERVVKETASLSELEFDRIIAIREKQVEDDTSHLEHLRAARATAKPLWTVHPDWTFGDCCAALRGGERGAA